MEKLLARVYNSKKAAKTLKILSSLSVLAIAFIFGVLLLISFHETWQAGLAVLLSAMISFIAVAILRKLINAPRPYEVYGFYSVKPKDKCGCSFPSRHAFSAFVIATLSAVFSPWLATAAYILALCICICRVLLGIHFVRDVAAGAGIGLISGLAGCVIVLLIRQ